MKRQLNRVLCVALLVLANAPLAIAQDAGEAASGGRTPWTPFAIAFIMGLAALGGTMAQGRASSSALESIGRNPSAQGKIMTPMLIGLAFIESLVILSFVICFLLYGTY